MTERGYEGIPPAETDHRTAGRGTQVIWKRALIMHRVRYVKAVNGCNPLHAFEEDRIVPLDVFKSGLSIDWVRILRKPNVVPLRGDLGQLPADGLIASSHHDVPDGSEFTFPPWKNHLLAELEFWALACTQGPLCMNVEVHGENE